MAVQLLLGSGAARLYHNALQCHFEAQGDRKNKPRLQRKHMKTQAVELPNFLMILVDTVLAHMDS